MKNASPEHCQHISIARNDAGRITICPDCNVVHVDLDYMTLRFTPETFRGIAELLASAQARLDRARVPSSPVVVDEAPTGAPSLH